MKLGKVHVKWSVILMGLSGPDVFVTLWMKGKVLHRERIWKFQVGNWFEMTKKLPTFLLPLNEISGGCGKVVPGSESF